MNDFLYRGIIEGLNARFVALHASSTVQTGIINHNCDPVSGLLLARALTSGLLISPVLQDDHRFTVTWEYDGPIGKVIIDVGANSDIRGLIQDTNLASHTPSVNQAYGKTGSVSMVRSTSRMLVSSSSTEAQLLEISDDLGFFFATSEQVETEFAVAVNFRPDADKPVSLCAGFMLQALPGCDLEKLDRARQRMTEPAFVDLLNQQPDLDNHVEKLINLLFDKDEENKKFSINACPEPKFQCSCSKEKTYNAVRSLTVDDLEDYLAKKEEIKVDCHFCAKKYTFDESDIKALVQEKLS